MKRVINKVSHATVAEAVARLIAEVEARGMKLFASPGIDRSAFLLARYRSDAILQKDQLMRYLRKDRRLYELLGEDIRVNAGLGGSLIREAAVRDVVTEDVTVVWGEQLVAYEPVSVVA